MDLRHYGIKGVKEVLYNPTYEVLYNEETKPGLTGFEKGQVTELGAINVMTGVFTGRSLSEGGFPGQAADRRGGEHMGSETGCREQ